MRLASCAVLLVGCASSAPAPKAATPTEQPAPAALFDRSSEDAFRASVRARMLAGGVVESAEPGDEPLVLMVRRREEGELQVNLHRMWDLCTRQPDRCDANVVSLIAGIGRTQQLEPTRETFVATLRVKEWVEYAEGQVPEIWAEPFVGELITRPEAAALALANVEKTVGRVDELARQLRPGLLTVTCGTDADIARMRAMAADLYAKAERPLTTQVMVWRDSRWEVAP